MARLVPRTPARFALPHAFGCAVLICAPILARHAIAQQAPGALSLGEARAAARAASAELTAARATIDGAAARERQAGVRLNPVVAYNREQTGGGDRSNSQDIIGVDQAIEPRALRAARVDAAHARRTTAEARIATIEAQIDYDVARAYAFALAADRRAALAGESARAFAAAVTVSDRRLREGDISGFSARRIRLESTRYAALEAEAALAQRSARLALGALLAPSSDAVRPFAGALVDSAVVPEASLTALTLDSLTATALRTRGELRVAMLEVAVAEADARLFVRERSLVPTVSFGLKTESVAGTGRLSGIAAGVSLPVPLWDKRVSAIEAGNAEVRRRTAELEALRRRVAREVAEAADALSAVRPQLALLSAQFIADANVALRSARTAYAEGEITLLEWLDTVRAYQEAETSLATLRAEYMLRAAALERAAGVSILPRAR